MAHFLAPDKSSGKRRQEVKIFFNFLDKADVPVVNDPVIFERGSKTQKTA